MNDNLEVFLLKLAAIMKEHNVCLFYDDDGIIVSEEHSDGEVVITKCADLHFEEIIQCLSKSYKKEV